MLSIYGKFAIHVTWYSDMLHAQKFHSHKAYKLIKTN